MPDTKVMTLRLGVDQAAALEVVARADEMPISDAVRTAIDTHIEARRSDADFQARLHRLMEENREVLERLAQ
jgi:FixJ family two-component response regulator